MKAPSFSLNDENSILFSLDSILGKKNIVLFFYPKNNTPVCTKEACMFRDRYEEFKELGAEVIGVSSDSESSHNSFHTSHNLNFTILSDEGGRVARLYGVKKNFFVIPGRETFVIDINGNILHRFKELMKHEGHIKEALNVLKKLKQAQLSST